MIKKSELIIISLREEIKMSAYTIKERVQSFGLKKVISYLNSNPDKNIPNIIYWVEKFDRKDTLSRQIEPIKSAIADKDGNWYQLVKSLFTDIDEDVRQTFLENFLVNATLVGGQQQKRAKEQNNCNIPWAILLDPTSACNLHGFSHICRLALIWSTNPEQNQQICNILKMSIRCVINAVPQLIIGKSQPTSFGKNLTEVIRLGSNQKNVKNLNS